MRLCLTAALLAAFLGAATARAESPADRWNLADLYPTQAAWDADAAKLESQLAELARCKGHLADNAARLRLCLDLRADMTKRLYRMGTFAGEQLAEDTGVPASLALGQRTDLLENKLVEASAFVEPEILRMGARKVAQYLAGDRALGVHRFPLERILRAAPHTLDDAGEALVAKFGLMNSAGQSAYSILTDADIPWPKVKLSTGEEITLDPSAYTKYREAANRDDRKRVMDAFFATFRTYERTLGVTLYSQLKQDKVYSSVRKYPDSITRVLDDNRIPVAVIDTLIAQTTANLPTLHRYFRLRAKMLGVKDMSYFDIYPPLVHGDFKFPLALGRQLTIEAVAPLGKDYVQTMSSGLEHRWMDAYPRPHKQSGAHATGGGYDVHPFVLMNYNDDYESVTTLAHEWGHAMHSYLANRAQPFVTSQYATFTAEIASTFNEELLLDRMLKAAKTDDERLYYLGTSLEGLRATFFRQAMFAEFERNVHARADRGEPLTGDALTKTYCEILKRHHGTAEGVVAIDDAYCTEWAYIPHFYNSFYVYQYSTSIAASSLFAQQVAGGEKGALDRYLGLLRAGGSNYPYELVMAAGVDLATPAPYQALVARMNRIMDEIEAILAKRK
ncbi:oligoendopeptidase F [Piscinibacter sp.]|jgi:oligoendopeptidase F|uniref:oligoendopeptidase F n=1 Tax=Piscinibacter sp. TaxID=1903157 RepID=UPI00355A0A6D